MADENIPTPDDEAPVSPLTRIPTFSEFMAEHRGGQLDTELGQALANLSQRVMMQDKGGKLVLTIGVKPSGQAGLLVISEKVAVSPPEPEPPATYSFVNDAGGLSQEDPRRVQLPFVSKLAKEGPLSEELTRLEREQAELAQVEKTRGELASKNDASEDAGEQDESDV